MFAVYEIPTDQEDVARGCQLTYIQLANNIEIGSGTCNPLDIAAPTKQLMEWRRTHTWLHLLSNPGKTNMGVRLQELFKNILNATWSNATIKSMARKMDIQRPRLSRLAYQHMCSMCGKTFSTARGLKVHSLTHSNAKPHRCDQCIKVFADSSNLRVHQLHHGSLKSYKCSHCSKSFKSRSNLSNHQQIHKLGRLKKYHCHGYCNICKNGKYYKRLAQHKRTNHK